MVSESESKGHTPVLPKEVCELLSVTEGETVVDATVGLGGHSLLLAERLGATGHLIGLDVDPKNLDLARARLADVAPRVDLLHGNFAELEELLSTLKIAKVDVILADLGVSSTQLDQGDRGFSFRRDGPLDMRMDPRLEVTAEDLVNRWKEHELSDALYYNAQEFRSRKIAKRICMVRREGRIKSTKVLADVVCRSMGVSDGNSRRSKIHPATKTFQAIRMAVNSEIPNLETLLEIAPAFLNPGGRIGVIAFHSVEDKVVKLDFRKRKGEEVYEVLTKKPVTACEEERMANPRSRSAKFRVAKRLGESVSTL
jgi:16S rRNA (cytosine1402-N4)-methyltransferase